jgi:hypothetical protein
LKGVARQPEEGLQPVRSLSRAFGATVLLLSQSLPGACAFWLAGQAANAATLHQTGQPLQIDGDLRPGPGAEGLAIAPAVAEAPLMTAPAVQGAGPVAVIVGSRARRMVQDAVLASAILTARPGPVAPCADPGGAGLTLVTARAGGGLELIFVVLRSLRGPSFDVAQLP